MRSDATKAENALWQALRNRQLNGLKFKRQVPLSGYILDFVCFDASNRFELPAGNRFAQCRDLAEVLVRGTSAKQLLTQPLAHDIGSVLHDRIALPRSVHAGREYRD